jgi:tetratricopeptide (TPR) repeat protein
MKQLLHITLLALSVVACAPKESPAQPPAARWRTQIAQAEAASARGDRAEATRLAMAIVGEYTRTGSRISAEHVIAGRAYVLLSSGDASAARAALAAFDAGAADSTNLDATRRTGNLFLDKYNAPDARLSYESVLKRAPNDAEALFGLAQVEEFEGKPSALATARKALAINPRLVGALAFVARMQLEAEQWDSATVSARRALAVDSSSMAAWSVLGAIGWLSGDSASFRSARAAATAIQPRPSDFYAELAEAAVRTRRYAEAVRLAEQAVAYDSLSVRALGVLGTNQLRTGKMAAGQATLDRAFALDAFNVWHKNTLDLLDKLKTFRTVRQGRFEVVAPAEEADLLTLYIVPLLERAFDSLQVRYGFTPPTPVRLEFYRYHADFSVRSVGLTGLGALGVSFGSLLAMDTPSARDRGAFNWGSTAWHELTHAFTLGASAHRVPRWLSEGMSVLEERRALRGWGADASVQYLAALGGGVLRPISQLNEGFIRPRFPDEIGFSYYQASLFCEMVEALKGPKALPAMLTAYRDGLDTPGVFQHVMGMSASKVDTLFDTWMRAKFAVPLRSITADRTVGGGAAIGAAPSGRATTPGMLIPTGAFIETMKLAMESMEQKQRDSTRARLERAQALFPEYAGEDSPAWLLAELAMERGDTTTALTQLAVVTGRNETAWQPNLLEADVREKRRDAVGAMAALERLVWISPYDNSLHERLAVLATSRGDHARALRERRAVVANQPSDLLTARYELARAYAAAGDVASARRELLQVLEQAPSFEKAQALLLELRGKSFDDDAALPATTDAT